MSKAAVTDINGQVLSACEENKALQLVAAGQATIVSVHPLAIRLRRAVKSPARQEVASPEPDFSGEQLLLHICCGPCATFTSAHLATRGFSVTGYWYNPNIEPREEYELRKAGLERLATLTALPVVWALPASGEEFREEVTGHERKEERCKLCYRLRLRKTAEEAAGRNIGWISTSLLISPYQDLESIREIGTQEAQKTGVRFYYENMRRGYSERTRLSREYDLYLQNYCGCLFSAREADARRQHSRQQAAPQTELRPC